MTATLITDNDWLNSIVRNSNNATYIDYSDSTMKNLQYRGKKALQSVACVLGGCIDFIPSIFLTIADTVSCGKSEKLHAYTFKFSSSFGLCFAYSFRSLVQTINPDARFYTDQLFIKLEGNTGIIHSFTSSKLYLTSVELNDKNKKAASKCLHLLNLISAPFTRMADAALSIFLVPAAIVTGGYFKALNYLAFRSLYTPDALAFTHILAIDILNPVANTKVHEHLKHVDNKQFPSYEQS